MTLTREQIFMWEHGVLIYRSYAWLDAAIIFAHLAEIIRDEDEVTRCRLNQGLILARMGDYAAARNAFNLMPTCCRNSILACCVLAEVGLWSGDASEALAWFYLARDHLAETDDRAEFDRFDFKLTSAMVEENISILRRARNRRTDDIRFLGLHRLPADCMFSSDLSIQDLYIAIDSTLPLEIEPPSSKEQRATSHVMQARNKVLQWLHNSGVRRDSRATRLFEPAIDPLIETPVLPEQRTTTAKMVARDARVVYTSNRHLANFIRYTGPGHTDNTYLLDRAYVQKLLDSDSRPASSIYSGPNDRILGRNKTNLESATEHIVFGSSPTLTNNRAGPSGLESATHLPQRPFVAADDAAVSVDIAPTLDIVWPGRHQWNGQR